MASGQHAAAHVQVGEGQARAGSCPRAAAGLSFHVSGVVGHGQVVSKGGYFPSSGGLPPQVGRGSFDPTRFVLELSWQPVPTGGDIYIIVSLGVPWSGGGRREPTFCTCGYWSVSPGVSEATGQDTEGSWKLRSQDIVLLGFQCVTIYHHPCLQFRSN